MDSAIVTVEKAGLFDTLQDRGRYGYRSQGVPTSGAMDDYSYTVGNLLIANDRNAVSMEITLNGPWLRFSHAIEIVITGANLSPMLNDRLIELWRPIKVQANDRLTFQYARNGCRAYIAIKGGFQVQRVMGSAATYTKGNIGGLNGNKLQTGDRISVQRFHSKEIPCSVGDLSARKWLSHIARPQLDDDESVLLRVIAGPQNMYFSPEGLRKFFTETYQVTRDMDRMGIRLHGSPIEFAHGLTNKEIITDAVTYGAIQVPANGQPVILGADSQTTGGYAKIACVISSDLSKVAQFRPLQTVRFMEVSLEEAQEINRKRQMFYSNLEKFLAP